MDATRFDTIARRFAARRSRRRALAQAAGGLAAGALAAVGLRRPASAQDATPPAGDAPRDAAMLFLQAFQRGSVAPKEDAEGRYVLTLEQGLGQTIYFSDRPERIVGAAPTPRFLEGLGFPEDNPPNAALVVTTDAGETEIAVVELYDPSYDEATHTATYEVAVLAEWEDEVGVGFHQTPADLAAVGETFGAAHLFIDDCDNQRLTCIDSTGWAFLGFYVGFCWDWGKACCRPCQDAATYCNVTFGERECRGGTCTATWDVRSFVCQP